MPELPEVETVANGVHQRVHGQTILSVWTSNKPQTFKSPPAEIADVLTGARIDRVHRVGKTIVVDLGRPLSKKLSSRPNPEQAKRVEGEVEGPASTQTPGPAKNAQFLIHLGMTGRLLVSTPETEVPPHTHAILTLRSGKQLRFVDARRFGRLSVATETYTGPGKEPLTIGLEDFIALFHGRRTPIKAALLNQALLHGVGNIYADEALHHAGIRPRRHAGRLTRDELTKLRTALQKVLKKAIKLGGSSVSDYVDADGVAGFFQLHHYVYSRTGEPCRTCKTPIERIVIGGRSTHFCPKCQR
ncbi:MAG: bifunctional DNA-formamidopyrimidine glycosylase/DNA-(apurinic or apyrimidinic site) lyase [Acidobacteria bacterium]|nr:bifunctional DNA-formamidopyrimidine glycosylase/DNA-(apurinic or apyrimidinic site) lyase [Acidobacteriota bacterium]